MYTTDKLLRYVADNIDSAIRPITSWEEYAELISKFGVNEKDMNREKAEYDATREIKEIMVKYGLE